MHWIKVAQSYPEAFEVSKEIFETDMARLRRLEDKLTGQNAFLTVLITAGTAIGGAGLRANDRLVLTLTVYSFVMIAGAFFEVRGGTRSRQLYTITPDALDVSGTTNLREDVAATRLAAAELNVGPGLELNNLLASVQASIGYAVVMLALAIGELIRTRV